MQQLALAKDEIIDRDPEARNESTADVPILAQYLREIGKTELLTPEDEARLGQDFDRNRAAIVEQLAGLPAATRSFVLGGVGADTAKPRDWTFADLEGCYERLAVSVRSSSNVSLRRALRAVEVARAGLEAAREAMVRANLKLVAHVAKEYSRTKAPDLDLIQEGNLGLLRAVEKFEPDKGFRFSTYAYWWIRQSITRYLADKSRTVRIPVHLGHKLRKMQAAFRTLSKKLDREPTTAELADELKLPRRAVTETLRLANGH